RGAGEGIVCLRHAPSTAVHGTGGRGHRGTSPRTRPPGGVAPSRHGGLRCARALRLFPWPLESAGRIEAMHACMYDPPQRIPPVEPREPTRLCPGGPALVTRGTGVARPVSFDPGAGGGWGPPYPTPEAQGCLGSASLPPSGRLPYPLSASVLHGCR